MVQAKSLEGSLKGAWTLIQDSAADQIQAKLVALAVAAFPALKAAQLAAITAAGAKAAQHLVQAASCARDLSSAVSRLSGDNVLAALKVPFPIATDSYTTKGEIRDLIRQLRTHMNEAFEPFVEGPLAVLINVGDIVKPAVKSISDVLQDIEELLTELAADIGHAQDELARAEQQLQLAADFGATTQLKDDILQRVRERLQKEFGDGLRSLIEEHTRDVIQRIIVRAAAGL